MELIRPDIAPVQSTVVPVSAPLAVRLGFSEQTRVVIITADGLGASHAATHGGYDSLRRGIATSARLMVPAPWAREAAAMHRGEDVGVALTVLAEHERYRWGPITHAPSLVDGNGGFPSTAPDLWDHADLDEVRRECRAQLERAVFWGFDVTHLDSHLDALHLRPEFFDIELELAIDFGLPLRLPSAADQRRAGFPFRRLADEEGVVTPDHVIDIGAPASTELEVALIAVEPGVTELRLRPALDTPELRAIGNSWATQVEHHQALVLDEALRATVARSGVELIGYRQLRQVQRNSL